MQKLFYGGDYNPEQWFHSPEILQQDITYLKQVKMNVVCLGVFSWSCLEPEEGVYQLDWLKTIIDTLYANGIYTILATPSGARPKWLADKYPEVLRVREDRLRHLFGGRHNHCYTSPVYREKVAQINQMLAKTFGHHPAVVLWHISNEYSGDCHCPLCQEAFRNWLKIQYASIEQLNQAWCTTFWSHIYSSFDQIESPSSLGEQAVHGLNLAWKRFVSHQTANFAKHEIDSLRQIGISAPVTTNLMSHYQGLDYHILADCLDIISWDSYPEWHRGEDIQTAWENGFQHDFMRSLKQKPYLLMESCPSATNWHPISKLQRSGLLTASAVHALAHGADSVQYFQIRQSRGSSEKFHGAVIDHSGRNTTRVFQEIQQIGKMLEQLSSIQGSGVSSDIAILYDMQNEWAIQDAQGPRNQGLFYYESVLKSYQAFRKQGYNVDIINPQQNFEKYSIIAAPMLYLFRENVQQKIRDFVAQGGTFILTYWSGIVDQDDRCFLGDTPYQLCDVFGLRHTEIDALYDHQSNQIIPTKESTFSRSYSCKHLCDIIELSTAIPLMLYEKDFYANTPAVTKNQYQKGIAYYIATDAEQAFYDDFYAKIVQDSLLQPIISGKIPYGVEISCRNTPEHTYIFITNFSDNIVSLKDLQLKGNLLYGTDTTQLAPYESIILQQ